ncbi:MAG: amidohydrolase [Gammaproteobacteria bacterium]
MKVGWKAFAVAFAGVSALLISMPVTHGADVDALVEAVEAKVVERRRDIHQHPELGNREFRTAALVAEHLRGLGLEGRTGIAHTGVVGILRGSQPGPRVALRAGMDALPGTEQVDLPFASQVTTEFRGQKTGVMHACGHDAHVAILMGVAEALAGIKEQLTGEVMFIFQPAEEGPPEGGKGGAELMTKEGLFADFMPDAVFGLHVVAGIPADVIAVRPDIFNGLRQIAEHVAAAHEATVELDVPWMNGYPVTHNDAEPTSAMHAALQRAARGKMIEIPLITGAVGAGA